MSIPSDNPGDRETCPTCGRPVAAGVSLCRGCVMANIMGAVEPGATHADADDYDVEKELGRGGSGTVYLATDKRIGRQVAIKLLNTLRGHDEISEQRFRAEAEATAALDHPNIIPIHANGEMDGRLFFTMKYVDGGSLATRGAEFADPQAAAALMEKIARAVHHAHQRGILHRDLKPSNILLDQSGEPFVSDFGIAKRENDQLNLTLTGAVMGTPNYMSPEQALGDNAQLTTATDIFSLGAIFFELLNRRQAFEGTTSHAVMQNVIGSDATFTRSESVKLHRDLTSICLKALEKDPAQRYSSARAFAEDLAHWQRGEPVTARHITGGERALRWMRRRPVLVSAIAIALASMVIGTTVSVLNSRRADRARHTAEENAYFASVGSALSARERANFGEALRHLSNCPEQMRDRFEWRLVDALSRGDQIWRSDFGIGNPLHMDYDPNADQLVLLTKDRHLHHVDPHTGDVVGGAELPPTGSGDHHLLRQFSCAPDGRHYLLIDDGTLFIVERSSSKIIHRAPLPPDPSAVWLSADRVLYAHGPIAEDIEPTAETAWTYEISSDHTQPLRLKGWTAPITVSPDGKKVALVRMRTKIVVYPTESDFIGEPEFRLRCDPPYKELAFSGDMKNLAVHSGTSDSHLQIFDIVTGERVFEDYWPAPSQISLTSGRHDVIVTDQESWFARCRALGVRTRLKLLQEEERSASPLRRQEDGPIAPPPRSFTSNLTGSRKHFTLAHEAPLVAFRILPGEGDFYTASRDGSLRYWRSNIPAADPQRLDHHLATHHSHLPLASHNGEHVAVHVAVHDRVGAPARWARFEAGTARSYDGGASLAVLGDGRTFTRSADGTRLTCRTGTGGDSDSLIELWHIQTPARPGSTFVHSSVTPDERSIACLFDDHLFIIDAEARSATEIDTSLGLDQPRSISLSPNGLSVAVTGFDDGLTRVYDLTDPGAKFRTAAPETDTGSRPSACRFSPDGARLYVGTIDGWMHAFDSTTLSTQPAESWLAHNRPITALAISQDGEIIATAGGTSIALWSAEKEPGTARRLRLQINTGPGSRSWLQFCAEDTLLLHSAPDRPIEVMRAPKS